jgi:hypothetical protein
MGWPALRKPVSSRIKAGWISQAIKDYPAAACLGKEFWEGRAPPECEAHKTAGRCGFPSTETLRDYFAAGIVSVARSQEGPHVCCKTFALECGRFIAHPQQVNQDTSPPAFALPSPRFVCEMAAGCEVLVKTDFAAWYYQLGLPPEAHDWFSFFVNDAGDAELRCVLTVLPMGWAGSAAAADAVSRMLAGVPADEDWTRPRESGKAVYIDDLLFKSRAAAAAFCMRSEAGASLKLVEETSCGVCRYVGIDLRVPGGDFRASPKLGEKLAAAFEAFAASPSVVNGRHLAGVAVAWLERRGTCLAAGWIVWAITAPSRQGRAAKSRGLAAGGPERAALRTLLENPWRRVVTPAAVCVGASDASAWGWGWIWLSEPRPQWGNGAWAAPPTTHINFLELVAVSRAVRQAPEHSRLLLWVDNTCTVEWLRRGTSRTRFACVLLVKIEKTLQERGCTLEVDYVRSEDNPADGISRGESAPSHVRVPEWEYRWQRRVLGWATDSERPGASPVELTTDDGEDARLDELIGAGTAEACEFV